MPDPETASLHQNAVLWEFSSWGEYGKQIVSASPVEIDCRWEYRKSQFTGDDGKLVATDATVVVDREIALHSILWKGSLDDYEVDEATNYMEVIVYKEVPDVEGRTYRRTVGLKRFGNKLPPTA